MAFWGTNHASDGIIKDPKRKFRFMVTFDGIGKDSGQLWYAKTADKPSFTVGTAEHKYLNHTFYYPGTVTWNDVTITLVDPQDPDMVATLQKMFLNSGYRPPKTPGDKNTVSKASAVKALGVVRVEQLGADGTPVESWSFHNAFIADLKFGDLAYGDDELVEISVTLKYDFASLDDTSLAKAELRVQKPPTVDL